MGSVATLPVREITLSPVQVLKDAYSEFERVAIAFSGAEDVALIDMSAQLGVTPQVFTLDTGRLHPETYQFIETVRQRYGLAIDVLHPDRQALEALVRRKGLYSFYEDGHEECCGIRKLEPLRRKLAGLDAWITGQRRDQSPTRTEVPQRHPDTAFGSREAPLHKFNPLAAWELSDVWDYLRDNEVPYNPLHDRGFISIGCEPCTRPVGPGEHERLGRWWWEEATQKECGLHPRQK